MVPELYFQLHTVHVTYLNHILPAVYVLLPGCYPSNIYFFKTCFLLHMHFSGKKQGLYKTMLQEIKNLAPSFDPRNVMVDFERASMNAIKNLFPITTLHGCFFHLCQNIVLLHKMV